MVIDSKISQGFAEIRRVAHQFPDQAQRGCADHLSQFKPEVRTIRHLGSYLEQHACVQVWNASFRVIQGFGQKSSRSKYLSGNQLKSAKNRRNQSEQANSLTVLCSQTMHLAYRVLNESRCAEVHTFCPN